MAVTLNKEPNDSIQKLERKRKLHNDTIQVRYSLNKMFGEKNNTSLARSRNISRSKDEDYGAQCQKPDMSPSEYEADAKKLWNTLDIWREKRREIELKTRKRSGCEQWKLMRRKLLTASHVGRICKKREKPSCTPDQYRK